jgi:hypothetical protein
MEHNKRWLRLEKRQIKKGGHSMVNQEDKELKQALHVKDRYGKN